VQTYQIQISDTVADKILWLLNSFKDDVKIKKVDKPKNKFKTDTSHIEFMSESEKQEIVAVLNNIPFKDLDWITKVFDSFTTFAMTAGVRNDKKYNNKK